MSSATQKVFKQTEDQYFLVFANTSPWTLESERKVGYYATKILAERVVDLVRKTNLGKLTKGIQVEFEEYPGKPLAPEAIVVNELDETELNRITNMKFEETIVQKHHKRVNPDQLPPASPTKRSKIIQPCAKISNHLIQGVEIAEKYAKENYGMSFEMLKITFAESGTYSEGVLDPIEYITIHLLLKAENTPSTISRNIGKVLPRKTHLLTDKTAEEISNEIKCLVDEALMPTA